MSVAAYITTGSEIIPVLLPTEEMRETEMFDPSKAQIGDLVLVLPPGHRYPTALWEIVGFQSEFVEEGQVAVEMRSKTLGRRLWLLIPHATVV